MLAALSMLNCSFEHGTMPADAQPDVGNQDTDGDGVLDSVDNCVAVANPDQHDHDGDGRGDSCDLCPHIAKDSNVDADGDGIGDDCDPRPTAKDQLVLWEGFYDPSSLAKWTAGGAGTLWTWQAPGTVGHDVTQPGDRTLGLSTTFLHPYVATGFEIGSLGSGASIGLCTAVVPGPQRFQCCTVRAAGPALYASTYSSSTGSDVQSAPWTGTYTTGSRIDLIENTASVNGCQAKQGTTSAMRTSAVGATDGLFYLTTAGAGARFDYVFLVEIGS